MSENDSIFVVHFVELCSYIIPKSSTGVKAREIHNFMQIHGAFYEVACCFNFQEKVRVKNKVSERV